MTSGDTVTRIVSILLFWFDVIMGGALVYALWLSYR